MKDGEREQPIENYGKKEWLDSIVPDPHPCTAGNKEEGHTADCRGSISFWNSEITVMSL